MYALPQEVEVWYIIPAIRREISVCLSKEYGFSYDKIAGVMGLTKAAVSQYISGKRAAKIRLHPKAHEQVKISCRKIVDKKSTVVKEILFILDKIRREKLQCEICGGVIEGEFHDCKEVEIPEAYD